MAKLKLVKLLRPIQVTRKNAQQEMAQTEGFAEMLASVKENVEGKVR